MMNYTQTIKQPFKTIKQTIMNYTQTIKQPFTTIKQTIMNYTQTIKKTIKNHYPTHNELTTNH